MKEINSKQFTNGFVSVLKLFDGKLIETTATCLPKQTEIRLTGMKDNKVDINEYSSNNWKEKFMIGVSTQASCPIKCKFCAVNKLTEKQGWRNLSSTEIVDQVFYAIDKAKSINGNIDPKDAEIFRVLFTRMGEPSLNIDNVIDAIEFIKVLYPNVRIQISTIGLKKSVELVDELIKLEKVYGHDWLELQFSIHSTDMDYRHWLQSDAVLSNIDLGFLSNKWYNAFENRPWKTTLNFALSKDTPFIVSDLKKYFDSKSNFIKISPINENIVSDENSLETLFKYENNI